MADSPVLIQVDGVSKRFTLHKDKTIKERLIQIGRSRAEDFWALRDISMDIHSGETVGLMGSNGSGKSTLLKVIGGIIQPKPGKVLTRGRIAALLELGAGFHQDLTGRENVFLNASILGMTREETTAKFDEIVDFSGIESFIDTQVKFYSSGMYVRLAFAVAIHVDPDILLVDEVLAVGDEPFQRKCMDKIRSFQHEGRTIVLVSHSASQVGELCDRAVVLSHGRLVLDGGPEEAIRTLRRGFEEESAAKNEDVAQSARILQATASGPGLDEPDAALRTGGDLSIDVDYEVMTTVQPLVVGIALETPLGQVVYRVNTEQLDRDIPSGPGKHRITFRLPRIELGSGLYGVSVGLKELAGPTLDAANQLTSFSVQADNPGSGLISARPGLDIPES